MRLVLKITRSEQMALMDVIAIALRLPGCPEVFVDVSQQPAVETHIGDLLVLVQNAKPEVQS